MLFLKIVTTLVFQSNNSQRFNLLAKFCKSFPIRRFIWSSILPENQYLICHGTTSVKKINL